jgi:hypothetical protein
VLHIAGFIMLCEGFLKIDPHVNLFRAFFRDRGLTVKGDPELAPVRGFGLQKKPRPSGDYPTYTLRIQTEGGMKNGSILVT